MYNNQNNNIHKYRGNVRILTLSTNKSTRLPRWETYLELPDS